MLTIMKTYFGCYDIDSTGAVYYAWSQLRLNIRNSLNNAVYN